MKIAIVSLMGGAPWGGSEALWHKLALYALSKGDSVLVSVYKWDKQHPSIKTLQEKGAKIHLRKRYIGNAGLPERIIRFIKNRKASLNSDYREIVDFEPGHIFISQGGDFDFALHHKSLYNLIEDKNIPYSFVCHSHAQYSQIPDDSIYPGAKQIFINAKQVFFISKKQQSLIERKLITVLKNGRFTWNPLNLSMPANLLEWPDAQKINMAIVGVLGGSKGQDTCFEVLSAPEWNERDWQLNVYGSGYGLNYLEKLAAFYKISDKVIFHGHCDDIKEVWQNNHILLVPSAWEGMPISILEALACGRPVISTDVGGVTEIVTEDINGYISDAPSVYSFSQAMERAWQNKESWQTLGDNSFAIMKDIYEPDPEIKIYGVIAGEEQSLLLNEQELKQ